MKILVLSDSHGDVENMYLAVARVKPDRIIHLGDGWREAQLLQTRFPALPLERVPGNCDFVHGEPLERIVPLQGHRVLLCHGHTLHVKSGLLTALYTAREREADVLLFGHTHTPLVDYRDGVWLLNPGSIGSSFSPTYGVLELTPEEVHPSVFRLE